MHLCIEELITTNITEQLTALLTPLVSASVLFCDPKTSLALARFEFLNLARSGSRLI